MEHKVISGTLDEISKQLTDEGYTADETGQVVPPGQTSPETPPADPPPADPPPDTPPANEPPAFDRFGFLSKELGAEFKSDEDFNTWKSTVTESHAKFNDLQKQYELAQEELKNYDIRKHFASDEDYIINQLKMKYPDLNPSVLSRVLTTDMTKADPIEAIAYSYMLNDKKHEVFKNEAQAYNYACKVLGYDKETPFEEQDEDVQVAVRMKVKEATEQFTKLKSEVPINAPVDIAAQVAERKRAEQERYDKLSPIVERDLQEVLTGLDKLEISETTKDGNNTVFSYDLGDYKSSKHVQDTIAQVKDAIARNAQEWTPQDAKDVIAKVKEQLINDYWIANRTAIIKAAQEKIRTEVKDAEFNKGNNNRPLNPDKINPAMLKEQESLLKEKEQVRKNLGLTGRQYKT